MPYFERRLRHDEVVKWLQSVNQRRAIHQAKADPLTSHGPTRQRQPEVMCAFGKPAYERTRATEAETESNGCLHTRARPELFVVPSPSSWRQL
jgi:hypothetical protein